VERRGEGRSASLSAAQPAGQVHTRAWSSRTPAKNQHSTPGFGQMRQIRVVREKPHHRRPWELHGHPGGCLQWRRGRGAAGLGGSPPVSPALYGERRGDSPQSLAFTHNVAK
jgi:hypothetical protein